MDWGAHNAGYVLAAYIVSAVCLIGIAVAIFMQDRKRAKALRERQD